ncbi:MAG: ABC transporter ATP-binding protein [Candidatus Dormibacteria bacterium]
MAAITFGELRYAYPNTTSRALDGIDLDIGSGLMLLSGASGSGKSTLLRVCNGLVPHFHGGTISGTAVVFGHDVMRSSTRELARDVGFVFQDPELQSVYPRVEHDVAFGLENLRVPRSVMRERVEAALAQCGITALRDRSVATLSGGERQRLALAGVLAMRPRLLVLDEPFSQLDDEGAHALREALHRVVHHGTGVFLAEHRAQILGHDVQRRLRIDQGRLRADVEREATPTHVVERAVSRSISGDGPGALAGGFALDRVSAGFGRTAVLHGVDLDAGAGEVIALCGRNGSGKSTLLRTIAGLLAPLSGHVRQAEGRIAYLPQNPSSLLHRPTVRDEVAWTLRRDRGGSRDVDDVLRTFRIAHVADRYPRDLSTGERQRAALAAVLAGSPSIALLDEPTRGMDDDAAASLVRAVSSLASRGATVVIATHDRALVVRVAARVVQLTDGIAVEQPLPHPLTA